MQEPTTFKEAVTSPDQSKWRKAMKTEMKYLNDKQIWDLVELPAEK